MPFSEEQKTILNEKLYSGNVSTRNQSGMKLAYIEGHYAIRTANKIFGFDGWEMFVNRLEAVVVEDTVVGAKKLKGYRVGYIAQVEISVDGVTRVDTGFGSSVAKSLVDCHELASKEAVTDALKRALRTFGDQFGNALYDKEQEFVTDEVPEKAEKKKPKKKAAKKVEKEEVKEEEVKPEKTEKKSASITPEELTDLIDGCTDQDELASFKKEHKPDIMALDAETKKKLIDHFNKTKNKL